MSDPIQLPAANTAVYGAGKVSVQAARKPVSLPRLREMRERGEKISMLTAYDATFASVMDAAGVDCILVGDSLGMGDRKFNRMRPSIAWTEGYRGGLILWFLGCCRWPAGAAAMAVTAAPNTNVLNVFM